MDAFKPADHDLGVQTIATEHARRILDGLTAQNAATAPAQGAETAARG